MGSVYRGPVNMKYHTLLPLEVDQLEVDRLQKSINLKTGFCGISKPGISGGSNLMVRFGVFGGGLSGPGAPGCWGPSPREAGLI